MSVSGDLSLIVVRLYHTWDTIVTRRRRNLPHPSTASRFEWDEWNEAKLAEREISAADVEHVYGNRPIYRRNKNGRAAVWIMRGRDRGGRELEIGITWVDTTERVLRAVTAWKV